MMMAEQVKITPREVSVDGKVIATRGEETDFVARVYREMIGGYPKFFKMDGLSRLGVVAAELLLRGIKDKADLAVSLVTCHGCKVTDEAFLATVASDEEFYPSPALFVYTLPNIVAGEIAIRHGIYGETCVYMAANRDEAVNMFGLMPDGVVGWIDYQSPDDFICELFLKQS